MKMIKIILLSLVLLVTGCGAFVDHQVAIDSMEALGFTDNKITDYDWLFPNFAGCSGSDSIMIEVTSKRNDKTVVATVCCGAIFKKCTVRL